MQKTILFNPQETPLEETDKLIQLKGLLTASDKAYIAQRNLFFLTVKIHGHTFYATQDQRIPFDSILMRDRQENIIGIPAVMGG